MTSTKSLYIITLIVLLSTLVINSYSQGRKHVIQLSGIVLGEDSTSAVPGVHVYVPKAGRGTTTNALGYFSMPVLANDSIVISAIGYQKQSYIVPNDPKLSDHITLLIELVTDVTYLQAVEIMPFPTEELFKEAILALNLPVDGDEYENDHLAAELLAYMAQNTPMDAGQNYRNFMNDQIYYQQYKYGPRPNPLLNPFNWAKFIYSIKRGDFKKN